MTRTEMIEFIKENPNVKITHSLFAPDEYIYSLPNGVVYTEEGYLFEDWIVGSYHSGIRARQGDLWEDDWSLYKGE